MLSEQGKRLVSMAVTATLCAGLLQASAVMAAPAGAIYSTWPTCTSTWGCSIERSSYSRQHPFQYGAEGRKGKGTADFII